MKKLCICRSCKRRFLIEPGRDNCPKCGGVLYKTDLEEKYWDLYNEDQRAEVISKLMTEMEQNGNTYNHDGARQSGAQDAKSTGESAPGGNAYGGNASGGSASQVKSGLSSAFKNPAIMLGTVALCILLVVAGIYISGKRRNAVSETGAPVSSEIAQAAETPGGAASNITESDANPDLAASGEETVSRSASNCTGIRKC